MKNILWIFFPIVLFLSSCPMPFDDIAKMSSIELIERKTRGVRSARITVGIVQNGQMSFTVYGENGRVRPSVEHIYEIGSITKVITGQLAARAISENRVNLDDQIDRFLALPPRAYYPTMRRLLTHTSGYRRHYYEGHTSINFGHGENFMNYMTRRMLLDRIATINLENRDYPFFYSNFGISVAGLVLEEIYNVNFTSLVHNYLRNELGLHNTRVGDGTGDLSHYWTWDKGNAYIPSGALVSNVTDMMRFAQMQIEGTPPYVRLAQSIKAQVNARDDHFGNLVFQTDAMGLGWMIDSHNNIIFHCGTTSGFCTFLGIDMTNDIAVVVLSNVRGNIFNRINSQTIGSKIIKELR